MNTDMDIAACVRQWVVADNQLKKLNESRKALLAERSRCADTLERYAPSIPHGTIAITDGVLKLSRTTVRAPLTLQHVESCLHACIPNASDVETIMNLIKERRPVKNTFDVKRTCQNPSHATG